MPVLAITGGIATGKSSFVRALRAHLPAALFDADARARELLAGDEGVRAEVKRAFGEAIFASDGKPDRARLREIVFANPAKRAVLEDILHPAIRSGWTALAEQFRTAREWLLVDIPLLYETAAESLFERVVVVACAPETQSRRLQEVRKLEAAISEKMVGAQHDLRVKMTRADHLIWNDSTVACLDGQARLLAAWLCNYYG